MRFTVRKFHTTWAKQKLSDCPRATHQLLPRFSLQFQLSETLWSKRRTEAKTPSGSTLDQALGIEGGERGAAASHTLGVCRSLCISPQRQLRLGVGGLCISLFFTHAWRAWAWIHLSSSPCSLPVPVYLYLILPAWLNLWEAPVLVKAPPAETKAKRQSSLYRWHTNAVTENILSLENTHTPTKSNKQKPKYTLRWLQTQRKGFNGCLKDLYSLQNLDRQRFPQKLPDSRLSCKWGACLDSVFWGKQTYIGGQLRRQGCHLLLRGVQLATQLSDLLFGLGEKVQR